MGIFSAADILLPKAQYREKFAVVACDQYTSQPEYWEEVSRLVGESPSALKMIVPEAYLNTGDIHARINAVNQEMDKALDSGVFEEIPDSFIYIERQLRDGGVRRGLLGKLDLKYYDYHKYSKTPVRATEATILDRIPPRVAVRENAPLECPHILILIDDETDQIMNTARQAAGEKAPLYDFPLMMDSGSVRGWRIARENAAALEEALSSLENPQRFSEKHGAKAAPLIYAAGDGNHSLATAQECYHRLCEKYGEEQMENHPARYALVELVNLHDASLAFEPVHRVVFDVDRVHFLGKLTEMLQLGESGTQQFTYLRDGTAKTVHIGMPTTNMTVGSLQDFIDDYTCEFGGRCDYIHGEDVVRELSHRSGTIGFLLPAIDKSEFFKTVILDGSLTRKTFSMGNAYDKRFYLECRRIRK